MAGQNSFGGPGKPARGPGKRRKNWLTAMVLVAAVALAGWSIYVASATSKPSAHLQVKPEKGFLAPDFEATDIATGTKVKLSDLRGKPVFINFWATWCPWCRTEMPDIQKVYGERKDKIHVILVDADYTETPDMMKKFAEEYKISLPMLHDEKGEAANTYLIRYLPTSVFINKDGVITGIYPGALNERQMKVFLDEASK